MYLNYKRGTAFALSTALFAGMTLAAPAANHIVRPGKTLRPQATTTHDQQVLNEGGTLAAYAFGNLMDIDGALLQGPNSNLKGRDQQTSISEIGLLVTPKTNPEFNYAPTGSGTSSYDFVNQQSGAKGKNISQAYPFTYDFVDDWAGANSDGTLGTTPPYGFKGWAGTAASSTASDSLHWAAGDAPLPLGDPASSVYINDGLDYTNSLSAFNNGGTPPAVGQGNPGGYNPQRGPAVVVPVLGTGVATVINTLNLSFSTSPQLTQDDLCGIFTGEITDWNQTSQAKAGTLTFTSGTGQPITIVHRSDGSGTTFLVSYSLSEICSPNNPKKLVTSAHYWGVSTSHAPRSQGVGTDSNNYILSGKTYSTPIDNGAPEVVWPTTSIPASGNQGVMDCVNNKTSAEGGTAPAACEGAAGLVGYVSPSLTAQVISGTSAEAAVQNLNGDFELATSSTVKTALDGSTKSANGPKGYPINPNLYFPFPTTAGSAPIVGYTYGYFYQCSAVRLKDQVNAIIALFRYVEAPDTVKGVTAVTPADQVVNNWILTPMPDTLKNSTEGSTAGLKAEASGSGTYHSPVDGSSKSYSCAPV